MSDLELPPVHQAVLDHETLLQLARDIEGCTELIDVSVKYGRDLRAQECGVDALAPGELVALVEAGQLAGVQLRYMFEGAQWWDTLLHRPDGVHLTRIRHTFTEEGIHCGPTS